MHLIRALSVVSGSGLLHRCSGRLLGDFSIHSVSLLRDAEVDEFPRFVGKDTIQRSPSTDSKLLNSSDQTLRLSRIAICERQGGTSSNGCPVGDCNRVASQRRSVFDADQGSEQTQLLWR
jgi:hypothetical protein